MSDMRALETGTAVRARERLPGIVPSHFCSVCPTFFQGRDRFYLTARREKAVHGIAVWPHSRARVRLELTEGGFVFLFRSKAWVMVASEQFPLVMNDFFWGHGRREVISWSRRRGFGTRLVSAGDNHAQLKVDPAGPHFPLLVIKSWAQENDLRNSEQTVDTLELVGVDPIVFGLDGVPS